MQYLRTSLLAIGLLAISGCSTLFLTAEEKQNLTVQDRALQIQAEYTGLVQDAVTYGRQPTCTAELIVGCADDRLVIAFDDAADFAEPLVASAVTAARAGASDAATLMAAARVAVAQLSLRLVEAGIIAVGEPQ